MSTVKSQIQPADYERLRAMLRAAFPDQSPQAQITDVMVDSFVQSLWSQWKPSFQTDLGVPAPEQAPTVEMSALMSPARSWLIHWFLPAR